MAGGRSFLLAYLLVPGEGDQFQCHAAGGIHCALREGESKGVPGGCGCDLPCGIMADDLCRICAGTGCFIIARRTAKMNRHPRHRKTSLKTQASGTARVYSGCAAMPAVKRRVGSPAWQGIKHEDYLISLLQKLICEMKNKLVRAEVSCYNSR